MSFLWLIISWVFYFVLHSLLALTSVKNLFYGTGMTPRIYRLSYNILAVVLLIPILIVSSLTQTKYLFEPSTLFRFIGLVLATRGSTHVPVKKATEKMDHDMHHDMKHDSDHKMDHDMNHDMH